MKDPNDFFSADFFAFDFRNDLSCPVCQALLVAQRTGRPPVYCSNACKMKAYRVRASVTKPRHTTGSVTEYAAYRVGGQ